MYVTLVLLLVLGIAVALHPPYPGRSVHAVILGLALLLVLAGMSGDGASDARNPEPAASLSEPTPTKSEHDATITPKPTASLTPLEPSPTAFALTIDPTSWKNETECRRVLEQLFQRPFKKVRPDWLKNPKTKRNLELDGFNADVPNGIRLNNGDVGRGIAFEYNGKEHYEFCPRFHRTSNEVAYQREKDALKAERCRSRHILLLVIPYTVRPMQIRSFIRNELANHHSLPTREGDLLT
jgi:hypothetical protein